MDTMFNSSFSLDDNLKLSLISAYFSSKLRNFMRSKLKYVIEILKFQNDFSSSLVVEEICKSTSFDKLIFQNILLRYMPDDSEGINKALSILDQIELIQEGQQLGAYKQVISDKFGEIYTDYCYYLLHTKKIDYKNFSEKIKNLSLSTSENKFNDPNLTRTINMGLIDPEIMKKDYMKSIIKTPTQLINESYPEGGLLRGQLGGVIAPSGVGKSIYLQNFGVAATCFPDLNADIKVAYFVLADLNEYSFTTRHISIALQEDHRKIRNPEFFSYYLNRCKELYPKSFDPRYYYIRYMAPGEFTAREIYEFLKNEYIDVSDIVGAPNTLVSMLDWYDLIFIDYEGVLKPDYSTLGANATLYNVGGDNMNVLKKLADYKSTFTGLQKVVVAAIQPKKDKSESLDITLDDISESAQKQRIIDFAYTFASPSEYRYPNFVGVFRSVKGRMSSNVYMHYFKDVSGRIMVRDKSVINRILEVNRSGSKILFTKVKSLLTDKNSGYYDLDGNTDSSTNTATQPPNVINY